MKREDVQKLSEQALSDLAEALRAGKSDTLKRYLAFLARFHNYSFGNVILIAMQCPEATHVAGFQAWKKIGRHVKEGEKAIGIIAPIAYRAKDTDDDDPKRQSSVRGFRVVHVFDVSQTDGAPIPDLGSVRGDPAAQLDRLRHVVAKHDIVLTYETPESGAIGLSMGGEIVITPNLPPAEEFSVIVHELAHEMLHRGDRRQETTKTIRETEAEAVAYAVSTAVGLDCSNTSADYIQMYSGDIDTFTQSLDLIQKVVSRILADLELVTDVADEGSSGLGAVA